MTDGIRTIYVIDSSSLFLLHKQFPLDIFPGLWERMDIIISEGRLITSHEVKREADVGDDAVGKWLVEHQNMVKPTTVDILLSVGIIIANSPPVAQEKSERPVADPFLIAQVLTERKQTRFDITEYCIVTEEKGTNTQVNENNLKNLKKIPDLCRYYDISCLSLYGFFRQEGWRF